jgi:hypothetical protein
MKSWLTGGALALTLVTLAAAAARPPAEVAWLPAWEAGAAAARESGKPIFLVFR